MGKPDSLASTSLALAVLIAICALLLVLRLWHERGTRDADLPAVDRKHFLFQDMRRIAGILLMVFLAGAVYIGSRMPTRVLTPPDSQAATTAATGGAEPAPPSTVARPNRRFLALWLAVFASIILLLGLAVIDWISTRRYALRHRHAMNLERVEILRQTFRRHDSARNGSGETPEPGPL